MNPIAFKVPSLANLVISCNLLTRGDLKFHTHYVAFYYNSVVNLFAHDVKLIYINTGNVQAIKSFEVYDFQ